MRHRAKELQAIETLQHWGVPYLWSPQRDKSGLFLKTSEMLQQLITSTSGRLRLGVCAFFLIHPEQARAVKEALGSLEARHAELLKCYYMAAVYLQSLWRKALGGDSLPDYFSCELKLPKPHPLNSRQGLSALEQKLQEFFGQPFNFLSRFDSLARLLTTERLRETNGPSRTN